MNLRFKGTRWHARKLSYDEVREIRKLSKKGLSQARIARQFCVSSATIHQIVHKATWKNA